MNNTTHARNSEFGVRSSELPHSAFRTFLTAFTVCCLSTAVAASSPTVYEKVTEQLSQTVATCRKLAAQVAGYDAVFRRDPMRPLVDGQGQLVTSAGLHGGLSVQGIIWSDERPLAIIDDELLSQGDVVGSYKILQIRADGLIAQRGEEYLFVPLDRGLETQEERPISPLSLLALPEDVPVPLAPRRSPVVVESGTASVVPASAPAHRDSIVIRSQ